MEGETGSAAGSTGSDGTRTLRTQTELNCPRHKGTERPHGIATWGQGAAPREGRSSNPALPDAVNMNHCVPRRSHFYGLSMLLPSVLGGNVFSFRRASPASLGGGGYRTWMFCLQGSDQVVGTEPPQGSHPSASDTELNRRLCYTPKSIAPRLPKQQQVFF